MSEIGLNDCVTVASLLFAIGFLGVMLRRNLLTVLMSIELMLNASNLLLVSFSRYNASPDAPMAALDGPVFVFFIIAVAAAEVAIGLAIVVALRRKRGTVMADELNALAN